MMTIRSLLLATALPALTPAAAARRSLLSPPLRGRVGEGGTTHAGVCGSPPSLTLPRKGGGNRKSVATLRSLLLATALLASSAATALAQSRDDVIAAPVLRANVTVSG